MVVTRNTKVGHRGLPCSSLTLWTVDDWFSRCGAKRPWGHGMMRGLYLSDLGTLDDHLSSIRALMEGETDPSSDHLSLAFIFVPPFVSTGA